MLDVSTSKYNYSPWEHLTAELALCGSAPALKNRPLLLLTSLFILFDNGGRTTNRSLQPPFGTGNHCWQNEASDISGIQMPHVMLPGMVSINNPDYNEQGAGIYAIPCLSHDGVNSWVFS
ncbi:hypothetical protein Cni_G22226 [Canna indica]|uniref:Uncharacterized protein n=1 Tax=Canna indica TaxID=4628 RepID=A0AAQ3QLG5_9LILI|nr:hypothetical protein Cni_G22226 [Canna indica]